MCAADEQMSVLPSLPRVLGGDAVSIPAATNEKHPHHGLSSGSAGTGSRGARKFPVNAIVQSIREDV